MSIWVRSLGPGSLSIHHLVRTKYQTNILKLLEKYYYFMFEGKEGARSSRVQSDLHQHVFHLKFVPLDIKIWPVHALKKTYLNLMVFTFLGHMCICTIVLLELFEI